MMYDGMFSRDRPFAFSAIQSIASLQYYCLAAIVVLYYDFALTIGQEIERIWKQKMSIVSAIYVLNRYLTCLGYIPVIYFLFNSPNNDHACTMFARLPGSLSTITQFFVVVLLVMRVYVLYHGKTWILWVTIPLGALTVAISAWGLTQVQTSNFSFGPQTLFRACVPASLKSDTIFKVSWIINGAFDTLIFALTVYKTFMLCKEHRQVGMQSGLARLLVRDGGMFFGVLAVANIANAILFVINEKDITFFEQSAGNNSVLTHTLSSTLLSRLILNLREAGSGLDTNSTRFSSRFSSAPREDIMLVSTSTFSNTTTLRGAIHPWLATSESTAVGSTTETREALTRSRGDSYV